MIYFSYQNAHIIQCEIAELSKKEKENFDDVNKKKLQNQIDTKKQLQANEKNALDLKIQATYNEFKRDRAIKVQALLMKFKNKFKELEAKQKREIAPYEQINKNPKGKIYIYFIIFRS